MLAPNNKSDGARTSIQILNAASGLPCATRLHSQHRWGIDPPQSRHRHIRQLACTHRRKEVAVTPKTDVPRKQCEVALKHNSCWYDRKLQKVQQNLCRSSLLLMFLVEQGPPATCMIRFCPSTATNMHIRTQTPLQPVLRKLLASSVLNMLIPSSILMIIKVVPLLFCGVATMSESAIRITSPTPFPAFLPGRTRQDSQTV